MHFGGKVKLNPVGLLLLFGLTFIFFLYILAGKHSNVKEINLKNALIAAINAAVKGGEEIKVLNNNDIKKRSKGRTKDGANEFLTNADLRSHCVMYYGLHFAFPLTKVISEEKPPFESCLELRTNSYQKLPFYSDVINTDDLDDEFVPASHVTVWIDPLDATQEFTEQLREYVTTMVCVAVKGKPVIGVIHQPFSQTSTTTWGWVGHHVSADLQRLKKVQTGNKKSPTVIVSRSHSGKVKSIVKKAISDAEVKIAGGAGYKVLQLINGNATAYVHTTNIKKWDICSGNAILNSVGGQMSTLNNKLIDYSDDEDAVVNNGIVATMFNHEWFYQKFKSVNFK